MSGFVIRSTPGAALREPYQPWMGDGWAASPGGVLDQGYVMPRIRLIAERDGQRLPAIRVEVAGSTPEALRRWLLDSWCQPVPPDAPATIETPLTRPVDLPTDVAAAAAGQTVAITWFATWPGGTTQATLRLELPTDWFAASPAGAGEASAGAGEASAGAAKDGTGAAEEPASNQAIGFTVIDFGTTAITATMSYRDKVDLTTPIDYHQAEVLAKEFATLLSAEAPAEVEVDAWATLRARLAEELGARGESRDLADIAAFLADGMDDNQAVVSSVAAAVEVVARQADSPAVRALARLRDDCFRAAFAVPPRDLTGMFPVTYSADDDTYSTLSSAVHITDLRRLDLRLWHREVPPPGVEVTVRGLKSEFRNLGAPPRLDSLAEFRQLDADAQRAAAKHTSADLVERAFAALRNPLEDFAARDPRITRTIDTEEKRRQLRGRIVVTYPTMMPPDVREHLMAVVGRAFRDPVTGRDADTGDSTFDEGVGAALYFTMLTVGASEELGAELLRAGAHPVRTGGGGGRWRRIILVIDIGGGTTDIALVRLNLTEIEADAYGRRFELRPEVLGATGHPQLGGNYLTLRVLYWIKALIADELLAWKAGTDGRHGPENAAAPGGHRSFAARILDQGAAKPVPGAVRRELDRLVPTHGAQRAAVFAKLWDEAEQAKKALGARDRVMGKPYPIPNAQTLVDLPAQFADAPAIELHLSPADFARVVRPVVDRAAQIAADLVVGVFSAAPDDALALDQIALCGRTSGMPMVRQAVVDRLAVTDLREGTPLVWNEDAVVVEERSAKEAVSMGVAWAVGFGHSVRYAQADDSGVDRVALRTGLQIETNTLVTRLPCSFDLVGAIGGPDRVLRMGDPLVCGVAGTRPSARSRWMELRNDVELFRPIDATVPIQWARFRVRDHAGGHDVTGEGWAGSSQHHGPRVLMQVVVDDGLRASVNLSLGRGHIKVEGPGVDVGAALPSTSGGGNHRHFGSTSGERKITGWPWPIVAVAKGQDARKAGTLVLPVPVDASSAFPETFVLVAPREPAEQPGRLVRGVLSRIPLPPPGRTGFWELVALPPEGAPETLGELAVPPVEAAPGAVHLLSLDATGRARIHLGWPEYLAARDLAEVELRPGAVLTVPMSPTVQDFDADLYPFNGTH
ncbi:hypothetical protein [Frankia tisae]|uniref:hypothetical protein n=1 Tax=Frankia tisae TaxID=2950104 RepID=UPI0021BEEC4F|nr:hypothetical protein [Frankia tisae]